MTVLQFVPVVPGQRRPTRHADFAGFREQAFYRPHHPLVRAAWPFVRRYPRKFVRESADAMRRAVSGE